LENGDLKLKVARNVEKQTVLDASEISYSVIKDVASGGKPILTMDAMGDEKLMQRQSIMDFNIKSLVCVPIKLKDKILGTVYVDSTGKTESIVAFTNIDLEFLEAFAGIVGISIENARLLKDLKDENVYLRNEVEEKYKFENIIGNSFPMQKVFELIEKVADTNATALVTGESGVGKELVARAIHFNSSRRDSPLVVVNCGAIPETLLESELFGYEKGAFTGAANTRLGRFEIANGGSIFLDEIGDMSVNLQVKLLRVLQERSFERIGGSKTITVDLRIIAATNRSLEDLVKQGKFREDLYYRLNVVPIHIPPLRERRQDIPLLLNYFLEQSNRLNNANIEGFTEEAIRALLDYQYPGNVRELQNIVERMAVLKRNGYIDLEDLPEKLYAAESTEEAAPLNMERGYDTLVSEFEKTLISKALQETQGVKSKAAQVLSINRTTLIEKMKRLGID